MAQQESCGDLDGLNRHEQLVGRDAAGGKALFVDIAAERVERGAVWFETVGPEVGAEDAA